MKVNEFLNSVTESYKREFPNSIITAQLYRGLGKSIYIRGYIAGSKEEFTNGIAENDMLSVTFWIHNLPNDTELESELHENIQIECTAKSYRVKPESQYMCYSSRNLSYRKTKGAEKILKSLDKFFINTKKSLLEDLKNDNIHDNHKELLKSKLSC